MNYKDKDQLLKHLVEANRCVIETMTGKTSKLNTAKYHIDSCIDLANKNDNPCCPNCKEPHAYLKNTRQDTQDHIAVFQCLQCDHKWSVSLKNH